MSGTPGGYGAAINDGGALYPIVVPKLWNPDTLAYETQTVEVEDLSASAPGSASVGVASAQAVAANANRKGLVIVNLSSNRVSIGIGQAAVLDKGITLTQNGVWEMDKYTFSKAAINAIAAGAASPITIQEFT